MAAFDRVESLVKPLVGWTKGRGATIPGGFQFEYIWDGKGLKCGTQETVDVPATGGLSEIFPNAKKITVTITIE
jgi:hypothetical protein